MICSITIKPLSSPHLAFEWEISLKAHHYHPVKYVHRLISAFICEILKELHVFTFSIILVNWTHHQTFFKTFLQLIDTHTAIILIFIQMDQRQVTWLTVVLFVKTKTLSYRLPSSFSAEVLAIEIALNFTSSLSHKHFITYSDSENAID